MHLLLFASFVLSLFHVKHLSIFCPSAFVRCVFSRCCFCYMFVCQNQNRVFLPRVGVVCVRCVCVRSRRLNATRAAKTGKFGAFWRVAGFRVGGVAFFVHYSRRGGGGTRRRNDVVQTPQFFLKNFFEKFTNYKNILNF